MEYAVKGNVQFKVLDGKERNALLADGYDIFDGDGGVLERSTARTVSYAEYARLEDAYCELQERYDTLSNQKSAPVKRTVKKKTVKQNLKQVPEQNADETICGN